MKIGTGQADFKRGLEGAKARLSINELWELLGCSGKPKRSCPSPFREDKHPSFSISEDGRVWKDHGTGDSGDAIDFLAKAKSWNLKEACKEFIRLAGGESKNNSSTRAKPKKKAPRRDPEMPAGFSKGTESQLQRLADLRNLSLNGLRLVSERGHLLFGKLKGNDAWLIADKARRNLQARRLDGGVWTHIGGSKAYTLPGSQAKWPVGIEESEAYSQIVLVEGGPDFLAAHCLIWGEGRNQERSQFPAVGAVAMLGAANPIPEECLECFRRKRVRIFPHADEAGERAAARWNAQLEEAGSDRVDALYLERMQEQGIGDLNDLFRVSPTERFQKWGIKSLLP